MAEDTSEHPMPSEISAAIEFAAEVVERLAADGLHLHFDLDESTVRGLVRAEMQDRDGRPLHPVSLTHTLQIAAGSDHTL